MTITPAEHAAFLRAVVAAADDDLPRMVYADRLDEVGDVRGEFIRVQVDLACLDNYHRSCTGDKCRTCSPLRLHERELLRSNWDHWTLLPGTDGAWCCTNLDSHHDADRWGLRFTRGFVSSITCTWADWSRHADAIRRATPLERVRLTTWPDFAWRDPLDSDRWRGGIILNQSGQINPMATLNHIWPGVTFELPNVYNDAARSVRRFGEVAERAVATR